MKKVTKAQIKAAPKYILGIDYKASYKAMTIELKKIEASDLREAMMEANKYWDDETVWCLAIYEKTENVTGDGELVRYQDCVTAWHDKCWQAIEQRHETCYWMTRWSEPCW